MSDSRPKVVQIGFNKTGTSSLGRFFKQNGYKVGGGVGPAQKILENINASKPPLLDINIDVLQDLEDHKNGLYAAKYYKEIFASHPESYFILTTRCCEGWINSRLRHNKGIYVERALKNHGIDDVELLKYKWREEFHRYHYEVIDYFYLRGRFFIHSLDSMNVERLVDFVSDHYDLTEKADYPSANRTKKD